MKLVSKSSTKATLTGMLPVFHSENPVKSAAAVGKAHMKRKCWVSRLTQLLLKIIYTTPGMCPNVGAMSKLKISRLPCLSRIYIHTHIYI